MGGRGGSSGMSGWRSRLNDNVDFNAFVSINMSNPDFKQFGRDNGMDAVKNLWRDTRISAETKNLHETGIEEALGTVRNSIPDGQLHDWFVEADSGIKPALVDSILSNPGTLNAGMNIAYYNYKQSTSSPMSFTKWVNTSQTMYRGERGQGTVKSDIFKSYTPDRSVAQEFGGSISSIRIKPKDTLGSYQTTAEQEFLVPAWKRR